MLDQFSHDLQAISALLQSIATPAQQAPSTSLPTTNDPTAPAPPSTAPALTSQPTFPTLAHPDDSSNSSMTPPNSTYSHIPAAETLTLTLAPSLLETPTRTAPRTSPSPSPPRTWTTSAFKTRGKQNAKDSQSPTPFGSSCRLAHLSSKHQAPKAAHQTLHPSEAK
jgi:hypothetical protein